MSSADAQLAYSKSGNVLQPVESQENFTQHFDLSQPEKAMTSYQKYVRPHHQSLKREHD